MDKVDHSFIPATKEKWYRYSGKQLKISYKTIYSIIIWHRNDNLGHLCQRNENIGSLTNPGELSSVQFSCSVVSDSLWPYELQHVRPPWPSPTTGVYSNSRPLSRWCHPAISSSVIPFSSCLQSFATSGSFPMSQLFAWGGQSTGVSTLASFLPKNTQG